MDKQVDGQMDTQAGSRDSMSGLSVVIPAYNEEEGIGPVLQEITRILVEAGLEYEVIVVDDGSQDQTAAIAQNSAGVRVIRHHRNLGYGAALKTGIRQARYELICITDADGTYPNDRISQLVAGITERGYDMVVGARIGKNASIPLARRPAKWMITQLARVVAGENIPDLNSGLRVFRRSVARRFFSLLPDGFSFTTTITLGLLVNAYSVEYITIDYYPRKGRSKIRPIQDTLRFFQLVLQIALYFAPMKIFLPLSVTLFFLGLAWGGLSYFLLGRMADASSAVILMASIQMTLMGLLADLINRRLPSYRKDEPSPGWQDQNHGNGSA